MFTPPKRGLKLVDWLDKLGFLKQREDFPGSWVIYLMKALLADLRNCMMRKKKEENERRTRTRYRNTFEEKGVTPASWYKARRPGTGIHNEAA